MVYRPIRQVGGTQFVVEVTIKGRGRNEVNALNCFVGSEGDVRLFPDSGGEGGGTVAPPPNPAGTVDRIVQGTLGPDRANISVKTTGVSSVRVKIGDKFSAPVKPGEYGWSKTITLGLAPGTAYTGCQVERDGVLDARTFSVNTHPADPRRMLLGFTCCHRGTADSPVYARMKARGVTHWCLHGDFAYIDSDSADPKVRIDAWNARLGLPNIASLCQDVEGDYLWSDHDFHRNGAHGGAPSKLGSQKAYREVWPWETPSERGAIYGTKTYGKIVRLIRLDTRSERSKPDAPDGPTKTMLGPEQKPWFKKVVTDAQEDLIVIHSDVPLVGDPGPGVDHWGSCATERKELIDFLTASGKRFEFTGGDMHANAINNGTSSPGGFPVYQAGPANQTVSHKGEPWTSGPSPATTVTGDIQQYGTLEVTRTDTALTTVFRAYDSADVEVFSDTKTWSMSAPPVVEDTTIYFQELEIAPRPIPRSQGEDLSWYPGEVSYLNDIIDKMLIHLGFAPTLLPSRTVGSFDPAQDINVMVAAVNAISERLGLDTLDIPLRKPGERGQFKDFSRLILRVRNLIPFLNETPPYTGTTTLPAPTAPTPPPPAAPTWESLLGGSLEYVVGHRGVGSDIDIDNALSSLSKCNDLMPSAHPRVFDGGDWRLGSGTDTATGRQFLPVHHDSTTGANMDVNVIVADQTVVTWDTPKFKNVPFRRGTLSTESAPSGPEWLERVRSHSGFCLPEDKVGGTAIQEGIVKEISEAKMSPHVIVQSFIASRLGNAKAAGLRVGLLQSDNTNMGTGSTGANAILTSVNGGPPDVVLYDPADALGKDEVWLDTLLAYTGPAGEKIQLQVGTMSRRSSMEAEKARLAGKSKKALFYISDNPAYMGGWLVPLDASRFDKIAAQASGDEHGHIVSSKSSQSISFGADGFMKYESSNPQWYLWGWATPPNASRPALERVFEIRWDALDTSTSRHTSFCFGAPTDRSYHDGSSTGTGDSSGTHGVGYQLGIRQNGGAFLIIRPTSGGSGTHLTAAQASGTSPAITVAGTKEIIKVGVDINGKPYGKRVGTDGVERLIIADAPNSHFKGDYTHVGKFGGPSGQRISARLLSTVR